MRIFTDRPTADSRLTMSIRCNLAAFVRHGRWYSDPGDLDRLLTDLEHGNFDRFLDPAVDEPWAKLVRKSVQMARRRLQRPLEDVDHRAFNAIYREWERAVKRSFGKLDPQTESMRPRQAGEPMLPLDRAA